MKTPFAPLPFINKDVNWCTPVTANTCLTLEPNNPPTDTVNTLAMPVSTPVATLFTVT